MTRRRVILLALLAVSAVGLLIAVSVPLYATNKPAFYGRYQRFSARYESWKKSKHRGVSCIRCHVGSKDGLSYRASLVGEYYRSSAKARRPVMAALPPASSEACRECHGRGRAMDVARQMRVPHPAHTDLAEEKRDCVKCHKWTAHNESYEVRHKRIAFTGICISFGCHVGTKSKQECRFCHHAQAFPRSVWRKRHPEVVAARGPNTCFDYCHKSSQCRTCHLTGKNPFAGEKGPAPQRLTSLIAKHAGPLWTRQHGTEARQDQQRCFYCHGSAEACRDCHSRRPAFHGQRSTWLSRHQKLGKNKTRCLACHVKKDCDDCHKVFKEGR